MIRFQIFGFPVVIHWFFWVNCALLGGAIGADSPQRMQMLLGWLLVAFASVLIHELGHAFAMRHFGDRQVGILLYAFGGLARGSRWLSRQEDVIISAAGPFTQLAAAVVMWWVLDAWKPGSPLVYYTLRSFQHISIFWAVLNLLPIIPLDGGHISRALFGPMRQQMALKLSLVCAVIMALYAIQHFGLISMVFFGLFAWNNYKELRGEPQVQWMAGR
jgi:Zn-dependent protease